MGDPVRTYDPGLVFATWGNIPLVGIADGTFVKASRDEDAFTKKAGAAGEVVRVRNRNKMGQIEITLLQSSSFNDVFSAAAELDELTGLGIKPFFLKDASGTTLLQATNTWVKKLADGEFAKDATNRVWVLDVAEFQMLIGGLTR